MTYYVGVVYGEFRRLGARVTGLTIRRVARRKLGKRWPGEHRPTPGDVHGGGVVGHANRMREDLPGVEYGAGK